MNICVYIYIYIYIYKYVSMRGTPATSKMPVGHSCIHINKCMYIIYCIHKYMCTMYIYIHINIFRWEAPQQLQSYPFDTAVFINICILHIYTYHTCMSYIYWYIYITYSIYRNIFLYDYIYRRCDVRIFLKIICLFCKRAL